MSAKSQLTELREAHVCSSPHGAPCIHAAQVASAKSSDTELCSMGSSHVTFSAHPTSGTPGVLRTGTVKQASLEHGVATPIVDTATIDASARSAERVCYTATIDASARSAERVCSSPALVSEPEKEAIWSLSV